MKKIVFSGLVVSMAVGTAFGATGTTGSTTLASKSYVDQAAVYLNNTKADKTSVYTKEESDARYLTSVDIEQFDSTPYNGDDLGVVINDHQVQLNVDAEEGSMYVYTSTGWSELAVEDEWSPDIFTMPSGD